MSPRYVHDRRSRFGTREWADAHSWTTEHLIIRPMRPADRPGFAASIDDEVRRWQGYDDAQTEKMAQMPDHLSRVLQRSRFSIHGCPTTYVVCELDGSVAGSYAVRRESNDAGRLELGWWLGGPARGRGLGRESLASMLAFAQQHLGAVAVHMATAMDNTRARAQIEACGAVLIDQDVPRVLPNGEAITGAHYRFGEAGHDDGPWQRPGWVPPCQRLQQPSGPFWRNLLTAGRSSRDV